MIKFYLFLLSLTYGLEPELTKSIVKVESSWKHEVKGDGGKSYGLFQIKCSTAKGIGFEGKCNDLLNPYTNIEYGLKYLDLQIQKYGKEDGISAYNAGRPLIKKVNGKKKYKNGKYVHKVKKYYVQNTYIDLLID